ncbi:hypothetical protein PC118_g12955 [Phytophthora cactorum]|uniref:Uncharacterized protein n=1 Tax=Phytophthora cactorum TaxID=29920 RepID=A0A8T1FQJ1_9STRA|nr:hypothetical protein PC118_g12955 [Phytophthora cactorum]
MEICRDRWQHICEEIREKQTRSRRHSEMY